MRALPDLLDLAEGTRLTGVVVLPSSEVVMGRSGRIVMQVAVGASESGSVGGLAVARFLPAAVTVVYGVLPDGSDWFATFEFVPRGWPGSMTETARAGLDRALDLTGVGVHRLGTHDFDWVDLHMLYADHGIDSVDDWSIFDLLLGLVLDLSRGDLAGVVASATDDSIPLAHQATHRRHQLEAALRRWATHYEGPEPQSDW